MTTTQKVIGGVLAAAVLVVMGVILGHGGISFGVASVNSYEAGVKWYGNGFYGGQSQQFAVDSSGNATSTTVNSATITTTSATINGVTTYYSRNSSLNTATS